MIATKSFRGLLLGLLVGSLPAGVLAQRDEVAAGLLGGPVTSALDLNADAVVDAADLVSAPPVDQDLVAAVVGFSEDVLAWRRGLAVPPTTEETLAFLRQRGLVEGLAVGDGGVVFAELSGGVIFVVPPIESLAAVAGGPAEAPAPIDKAVVAPAPRQPAPSAAPSAAPLVLPNKQISNPPPDLFFAYEIPRGRRVHLLTALPAGTRTLATALDAVLNAVNDVTDTGYTAELLPATVENLKALRDTGVFIYAGFGAHLEVGEGAAPEWNPNATEIFAVQTATPLNATTMEANLEEVVAGRLWTGIGLSAVEWGEDPDSGEEDAVPEWDVFYFATPEFFRRNVTLADEAIAVLAVNGSAEGGLATALVDSGASNIYAWDSGPARRPAAGAAMGRATRLIMARLLGDVRLPEWDDTPVRPFDTLTIYTMTKIMVAPGAGSQYNADPDSGSELRLVAVEERPSMMMRPSIRTLLISPEDRNVVSLYGEFGSDPAEFGGTRLVNLNGVPVPIIAWDPMRIDVSVPDGQSDNAGLFEVIANGARSNVVPLTRYRGTLRIEGIVDGAVIGRVEVPVSFRHAVHPYRFWPDGSEPQHPRDHLPRFTNMENGLPDIFRLFARGQYGAELAVISRPIDVDADAPRITFSYQGGARLSGCADRGTLSGTGSLARLPLMELVMGGGPGYAATATHDGATGQLLVSTIMSAEGTVTSACFEEPEPVTFLSDGGGADMLIRASDYLAVGVTMEEEEFIDLFPDFIRRITSTDFVPEFAPVPGQGLSSN